MRMLIDASPKRVAIGLASVVEARGGGAELILVTVAILAQGTSWAVAVTQASFAEVRERVFA